ncbi:homologous recombination OB-fold protein-like [Halichondria panicea]|uniref:homologous recombination OB-fold protein-like n=1 Tax=Halichondria panicea TaxID=6063 RepID=UPI00312B7A95
MALRNALQQLKHGNLSAHRETNKKEPSRARGAEHFKKAQTDIFSLDDDDDDLFAFDKDSLEDSFLTSATQGNGSTMPQAGLPSSSAQVLSINTTVPNSYETQRTVPKNTSGAPKPSSVKKLQSFKFVKTTCNTPTSFSILGKRTIDGRGVDDIKPSPPPKKTAPSDEEILDSFLLSDFMELDFPPPNSGSNSSARKDVHLNQPDSDEHLPNIGQQPSIANHPTTSRNLSLMNPANPRPPTNVPNSTSSLFKAPINRVKTTATICSPRSNSFTSTPINTLNISSNAIINSPSCASSNKQFSTPRNRELHPLTSDKHFNTPTNSVPSSQHIPTSQERILTLSNVRDISTPQRSRSSTPSCFRTPLSRQPTAMVCTPGGDACPPAVTRQPPHSARRRFPGPAGLLPSLVSGQCMDNISVQPPSTPRPVSTPRLQSLSVSREVSGDEECFSSGPWADMLNDLDMNDSRSAALLQYNIANAIAETGTKRLARGKVPHLRVLLKSIAPVGRNASAVLKDLSGEILCTIHSRVFEEHQKELQPGAAIILRQVSLFSPAPRKHYLNITPDNIIRIYPPEPSYSIPQGPLDLSGIERLYNSENRSPPNEGRPLPTSANTRTTLTRKVGEPSMVRRTPPSIHDSLTVITRDKPPTASIQVDLGGAPDFQTAARTANTAKTLQPSAQPKGSSVKEGFFDQFCDDDFDAIIGDLDDEEFNF